MTPAYGAFVGNIVASWTSLLVDIVFTLAESDKILNSDDKIKAEEYLKSTKRRQKTKDVVSTK